MSRQYNHGYKFTTWLQLYKYYELIYFNPLTLSTAFTLVIQENILTMVAGIPLHMSTVLYSKREFEKFYREQKLFKAATYMYMYTARRKTIHAQPNHPRLYD